MRRESLGHGANDNEGFSPQGIGEQIEEGSESF